MNFFRLKAEMIEICGRELHRNGNVENQWVLWESDGMEVNAAGVPWRWKQVSLDSCRNVKEMLK